MSAERHSHPRHDEISFDSEMQSFWHRFEQIHHQRREGTKLNLQKSDDENARAHGSEELERVLDKVHASEEENRRLRREVDELSIKLQRRKVNKRLSSIKNQKQHEKGEEDEEDFSITIRFRSILNTSKSDNVSEQKGENNKCECCYHSRALGYYHNH